MDNEGGKVTGIRQIVRLKEVVQKWQKVSVSERLKGTSIVCDSDEEGCQSPEPPPPDVPKGFLAVYVGKQHPLRRFIIPTTYLSHHVFKLLLQKAEEEYGFDHGGALTIPCHVETFKYLLHSIHTVNGQQSDDTTTAVVDSNNECLQILQNDAVGESSSCPQDS